MKKTVLYFSRSYLATLMPQLAAQGDDFINLYIVQTDKEEQQVIAAGGTVVLNLEKLGREALSNPDCPEWTEPADMRAVTGFNWSPLYADRYLPAYDTQVRDRLAGAIQEALEKIFNTHQISGVVTEPVALFPTHYLLYLCLTKNAVPLFWANTYFPDYFFFVSDVHIMHPRRASPLKGAEFESVKQVVTQYVERVAADKAGPAYHHQFASKQQGKFNYFSQRKGKDALILTPGVIAKLLQFARVCRVMGYRALFPRKGDYMTAGAVTEHKFYMRNLMTPKRRYDRPTDQFSSGNVFFPLQYEPEASLLYAAPDFQNQVALVEAMLQSMPQGHVLWVKEHPNQFGVLGHGNWQKLRKRYSNLRLIYGRENGRHLIQRCGLAVSITSTAGMDALILGRTCLVLGNVFFKDFPGAKSLDGVQALADALNDPTNYLQSSNVLKDTHLRQISPLVDFASNCYPGDPQPAPNLFTPQNLKHLYKAIQAELISNK